MSAPGPPKRRAKQCPELDLYKDEIILRFSVDRWPVKKIARSFNEDYGLNATEKQYSGRLQSWGCRKYIKRDEWQQIDHDVLLREQSGKKSQVVLNRLGLLSEKAIKKGRKRHVSFTDRIFIVSHGDPAPKTLEPPQVEVITPPNWEVSLPVIYAPKTMLSILPRLPITIVEEGLVSLILHLFHLERNNTQISTVKTQPFFVLLRTIIFRLSNNISQGEEIHALLDRVDEQGYRAPLKQLLSLKEVSIQAACSNLLKHLYMRGDRELVTHIHRHHPEIYPKLYHYLESASEVYSSHLSGSMLQSFKAHSSFYFSFSGSGYLDSCSYIVKEIVSRGLSPSSVQDAKVLLFVCKTIFQDLSVFLELWDSNVISVSEIDKSLDFQGEESRIPLFCENHSHLEQLYNIGFREGAALISLKASLGNHGELIQLCLRYFYTHEESEISNASEKELVSIHARATPTQLYQMIVDLSLKLIEMGSDVTSYEACKCDQIDFFLLYLTSGLPHALNDLIKVWNLRYTANILPLAISEVLVCCIHHEWFYNTDIYEILTNCDTLISLTKLHDFFYETGILQKTDLFATIWDETLRKQFMVCHDMYFNTEVLDYLLSRGVNIYQPIQISDSDAKFPKRGECTGNLEMLYEPNPKTPFLISLLRTTPDLFIYFQRNNIDILHNLGWDANTLLSPKFQQAVLSNETASIEIIWEKRFNVVLQASDRMKEKLVQFDLKGTIEECRSIYPGNTYLLCGLVYYWVGAVVDPYKRDEDTFMDDKLLTKQPYTELLPFAKLVLGDCELLSEKFHNTPAAHIKTFQRVTGADSLGSLYKQALVAAISERKLDLEELLLLHGPGNRLLRHDMSQGEPLAHIAIESAAQAKSSTQYFRLFIEAGISISMMYAAGARPLHSAIGSSKFNMIVYLLSEGADIYATSRWYPNLTAVEYVVVKDQIDVMAIFLEQRPDCYKHALGAAVRLKKTFLAQYIRGWKDSDQTINSMDRRLTDALIESL
ncbi:hypothetical protein H072_6741 [Dactylellina haptotyla CBS 200.50]|uniref:Clr5 domain-containing protein n=1 Tax=Dactylellina haptotyla (strain CBS 200.50) TaxID=1284197 RepID=S8BJT2_DACHA|nr:hypothetical protein H072_6741 [Dactylellina haptotyla CBS 200.50]